MNVSTIFKAFQRIPSEGKIALIVGLLANGAVVFETVPFLLLPYGSEIRPMGYELFIFCLSVLTLFLGLLLCIATYKSCSKRINVVILSLVIAPLPLSVVLLDLISFFCGLKMEQ